MRGLAGWLDAETMRIMGLALLHFLWQGAAIAAAAFLGMSLARRASAKYVVAVFMLALMVAAPAVTYLVLANGHPVSSVSSKTAPLKAASSAGIAPAMAPANVTYFSSAVEAEKTSIYLLWFVELWFVGVVLLSLRPAAGFVLIGRLRFKKGAPVSGALRARCLELQRRLGLNRVVSYCESLQLDAPAVAGWFRPVVLLPVAALTGFSTQQLSAVIAHELAHVKRLDSFVNLFQIAAETLLFYHPAVWWLSKRIRAERENCCDDVAIAISGNAVEYARALATMAEWQSAPGLAMAANRSPLTERVARLLGASKLSGGFRSAGIAGSVLCLCVSVVAGNALIGAAQTNQANSEKSPAPVVQPVPQVDVDPVVAVRPTKPVITETVRPKVTVNVQPVIAGVDASVGDVRANVEITAPVVDPQRMFYPQQDTGGDKEERSESQAQDQEKNREAREDAKRQAHREKDGSYIDSLKAEGLTNLSIDELIALKVQDVTAQYVRQIHEFGLKPDVNELIALKVQGVMPEVIRELRKGGLAVDIDQIIAMQVQGITPEYVKQMHDLGIETDGDSVIAMKVQGVSSDYVQEMRKATDTKLSGGQIVAMKVQGITPDYVRELKAMGLQVSADDVIAMKVQGVTPEYIKGLQATGLKLSTHDVIKAKVLGISPEFIERARSHGFQNLSMDKLVALRNSGVLDE
jgi:beta-lactamase regulating signal transducer with metallopeptidase domain